MSRLKSSSAVQEQVISRDPEVMGGQPVFAGTRVPVTHLIEHLIAGHSIDEFREGFPGVEREQIVQLLVHIGELVVANELTV